MPSSRRADGGCYSAKAPTTPDDESVGVVAAIARCSRGRAAASPSGRASRTVRRSRRTRCSRAARRGPRCSPPRASPTSSSSAARRAPTSTGCARRPAPLVPARAALRGRRALRTADRSSPGRARRARRRVARRRGRGGRGRVAARVGPPGPRARRRRRPPPRLPGLHVSLSHEVAAIRASTSAPPPPSSTRRCRRCCAPTSTRLAPHAPPARPSAPAVMQSSGGLTDAGGAAAHGALHAAVGARGRSPGRTTARRGGRRGRRPLLRHGRHLVRRVRDRCGRRPRDRAAYVGVARCPAKPRHRDGRCRRRLDRLAGRGRSVARRAAIRRRRPGPAAYGRGGREPTVTDAHVVLGHLPRGALAGGSAAATRRPWPRSRARGSLGSTAPRRRRGSSTLRTRRCSARSARDNRPRDRPGRMRSCHSAARARCTRRRSRSARDRTDPLSARVRRALGARARGGRAAA